MTNTEQQICLWCREDTSFGSGKFVNRIPASKQDSIDDEYETGFQCADCQAEECSICKESTIEYSFTEDLDVICNDCQYKGRDRMKKDIIKDCMAYFEEREIGCRNIIDDDVEILVRTSVGGKSDCWVQISEEEVYHRANDYQEGE